MPFTDQSSDIIILYFMNCQMVNFGNINNDPNKYFVGFVQIQLQIADAESEKKKEKG